MVVAEKVADQPVVVVAQAMAVVGRAELAIHRAEGGAMHPRAVEKSKSLPGFVQ